MIDVHYNHSRRMFVFGFVCPDCLFEEGEFGYITHADASKLLDKSSNRPAHVSHIPGWFARQFSSFPEPPTCSMCGHTPKCEQIRYTTKEGQGERILSDKFEFVPPVAGDVRNVCEFSWQGLQSCWHVIQHCLFCAHEENVAELALGVVKAGVDQLPCWCSKCRTPFNYFTLPEKHGEEQIPFTYEAFKQAEREAANYPAPSVSAFNDAFKDIMVPQIKQFVETSNILAKHLKAA